MIPRLTIDALDRYVAHGLRPDSFVQAVLENNLMEAFARADEDNIAAMFEIVNYCYNELPGNCWGSPERVRAWIAQGGRGE